ncbi:flagellar biosynthetic protein FliO [Pantoea sp. A4]|uniref:flagellar biosynthetic protein FliO n=1 Tax=Pantoea sp. A4 TaxID=1225184 RepID=UPI00036C8933|nr:flagellar biosynthetic protein FliO [Pantoea sp. A4]
MNPQSPLLHATSHTEPVVSTASVLMQIVGVLAFIILLILACAWLARRSGLAAPKASSHSLKLAGSLQVGQRERVVIVETADARLVLGVTAQQIALLHTLPPAEPGTDAAATSATPDFRQLLQTFKRRGKKS